jgi:hypothetical protein
MSSAIDFTVFEVGAVGGMGVEVGGIGVKVGGRSVGVGGIRVAVGGIGVGEGRTGAEVGGIGVKVGGMGVEVEGISVEVAQAVRKSARINANIVSATGQRNRGKKAGMVVFIVTSPFANHKAEASISITFEVSTMCLP